MSAAPPMRPIAILRWPAAVVIATGAFLPFLFVTIPPLTDVPGHIGGYAVQVAQAGDPVLRWFWFHWALTLNLAGELLVQLLAPLLGVLRATWFIATLTPVLTALGTIAVARVLNPRGASALPWALLFVYSYPFLWGFLNFALVAALALFALAGWVELAAHPRLRAAIYLVVIPLLLIGHAVAGVVALGTIAAHDAARAGLFARRRQQPIKALASLWAPALAALVTVAAWKIFGAGGQGTTVWLPYRKAEAVALMLRDQNAVLDIGSVVAAAAVWLAGWRWGARLHKGSLAIVLFVIALFVATPSLISGSDRIDTRLAPLIPLLAFALQDWSAVAPRRRLGITVAGALLLVTRLAVTTVSFVGYNARYRDELAALNVVRPGTRILNLTHDDCLASAWRSERLEHLANLATPLKDAWVNTHWSIAGLQLLQIRYSPSPAYDRDPSQLIWPAPCVDRRLPAATRDRHLLIETLPQLPLYRVDYLWLIGERLPATYRDPRLRRVWSSPTSELYATR